MLVLPERRPRRGSTTCRQCRRTGRPSPGCCRTLLAPWGRESRLGTTVARTATRRHVVLRVGHPELEVQLLLGPIDRPVGDREHLDLADTARRSSRHSRFAEAQIREPPFGRRRRAEPLVPAICFIGHNGRQAIGIGDLGEVLRGHAIAVAVEMFLPIAEELDVGTWVQACR